MNTVASLNNVANAQTSAARHELVMPTIKLSADAPFVLMLCIEKGFLHLALDNLVFIANRKQIVITVTFSTYDYGAYVCHVRCICIQPPINTVVLLELTMQKRNHASLFDKICKFVRESSTRKVPKLSLKWSYDPHMC